MLIEIYGTKDIKKKCLHDYNIHDVKLWFFSKSVDENEWLSWRAYEEDIVQYIGSIYR